MNKAFTLVELLTVIFVIAIVAVIAVIVAAVNGARQHAQDISVSYDIDKHRAFVTSSSNYYEVINLVEQNGIKIYTVKDTKMSTVVILKTNNSVITYNDVR